MWWREGGAMRNRFGKNLKSNNVITHLFGGVESLLEDHMSCFGTLPIEPLISHLWKAVLMLTKEATWIVLHAQSVLVEFMCILM